MPDPAGRLANSGGRLAAIDAGVSRLQASHLQKSYGSRKVVKDVSLEVAKGEVVGLLGPNGAGKTTSFYMIVGLVRADAGEIAIDGRSVQGAAGPHARARHPGVGRQAGPGPREIPRAL